jgi:hypothetical protein
LLHYINKYCSLIKHGKNYAYCSTQFEWTNTTLSATQSGFKCKSVIYTCSVILYIVYKLH